MGKLCDEKHIYYFQETTNEIIDLQDNLSFEEIGFYLIFKASYFKYKGIMPIDKILKYCRITDHQNSFLKFIEENFVKENNFYKHAQWDSQIVSIIEKSKKARENVVSRYTNVDTNVDTDEPTKDKVKDKTKTKIKDKENIKEKEFEIFWNFYVPIPNRDGNFVAKGNKNRCYEKFLKLRKEGVEYERIKTGLEKYLNHCQQNEIQTCGVEVFLNQERYDNDYGTVKKERTMSDVFREMDEQEKKNEQDKRNT